MLTRGHRGHGRVLPHLTHGQPLVLIGVAVLATTAFAGGAGLPPITGGGPYGDRVNGANYYVFVLDPTFEVGADLGP